MNSKTMEQTQRAWARIYFQQYRRAKERRVLLEQRHSELKRDLTSPTLISGLRDVPSSKTKKKDGAVSVVFRIAEVEERIEAQTGEMVKAMINIMDLIDLLPADSTERQTIELRHIDCKDWSQISREMHMGRSRLTEYYNSGLTTIARNKRAQKLIQEYLRENHGQIISSVEDM